MTDYLRLWPYSAILQIGGTVSLGFDKDSDLLLICTSAGRGIVDCRYPKVIARDYKEYYPIINKAEGIGPLENRVIDVIGFDDLNHTCNKNSTSPIIQNTDNWQLVFDARRSVFIRHRSDISPEKVSFVAKKNDVTSLAACCMSSSEKYLVVAYRSKFTIFAKSNSFFGDECHYRLSHLESDHSHIRYVNFKY